VGVLAIVDELGGGFSVVSELFLVLSDPTALVIASTLRPVIWLTTPAVDFALVSFNTPAAALDVFNWLSGVFWLTRARLGLRRSAVLELFGMLAGDFGLTAEVDTLETPCRRPLAFLGLSSLSGLFHIASSATV